MASLPWAVCFHPLRGFSQNTTTLGHCPNNCCRVSLFKIVCEQRPRKVSLSNKEISNEKIYLTCDCRFGIIWL